MRVHILIICILLYGCGITPYERDTVAYRDKIINLKKAKNLSKQEILDNIGVPDKMDISENKEVWTYWSQTPRKLFVYRKTKIADLFVSFIFDKSGKFQDTSFLSISYGGYGKNSEYPKLEERSNTTNTPSPSPYIVIYKNTDEEKI